MISDNSNISSFKLQYSEREALLVDLRCFINLLKGLVFQEVGVGLWLLVGGGGVVCSSILGGPRRLK